jgi:hypothetical protein
MVDDIIKNILPYGLSDSILGDHIFGLIPLLASCLNGAGGTADGIDDPRMHIDTSQQVVFLAPSHMSRILISYSLSRFMARLERALMSALAWRTHTRSLESRM